MRECYKEEKRISRKRVKRHESIKTFQIYILTLNSGPLTFLYDHYFPFRKKVTHFVAIIAVYCLVAAGKLLY